MRTAPTRTLNADTRSARIDVQSSAGGWRLPAWLYTPAATAVLLTALVGVSFLLRLEGQHQWFWIDEGLSAGISGHHLGAIPGVLRQDGSPPLYYLMLHVWMSAFGHSEVALHAFSLLFALLCVPAALWAGWSLFGRRVGWTMAVLAAFNPFLTQYGHEARMYTFVALVALLATACYLHAFVYGRRRYLPVLALLLVVLLYTHNWSLYFIAGALLGLIPCLLVRWPGGRRQLVRDALVTFGVAGLVYLPWVPTLLFQIGHTGAPWSKVPSLREAVTQIDAVLGDERALVAVLLAGGAGLAAVIARRRTRDTAAVVCVVLLAVLPLAISWLSSQVEPNWATRYFATIVGPILLVAALGLSRAGWQGIAALALILLFWTQPLGRITGARAPVQAAEKSNVKEVVTAIGPQLRPGDLVVSTHPEQTPVLHYYLPAGLRFATPTGAVPDPGVFDWRDVVDRMRAATPARDLEPLVDRLPVGARVVMIGPVGELTGDRDPDWFVLFHHRTDEWQAALRGDHRLQLVTTVGDPAAEVPGTSVYALLFRKISG